MDSTWQILVLGVVQGVTEFLPISSSGHLALLQTFFELPAGNLLAFDLMLHCATVLAVMLFFREDIAAIGTQWCRGLFLKKARETEGWRCAWLILAGTVVTAVVALPLEGAVEKAMSSRFAVGVGLLVTAGLLCLVPLVPERQKALSLRTALLVGLVQGLAVFPGVSRSGSTLAVALFMGLTGRDAFRLSFLMSIPAILGASLLEAVYILRHPFSVLPDGCFWAALIAFALGCLSLAFLRRLVLSGKWPYFGLYCFLLGLTVIMFDVAAYF
ncbi:MAG: undecaprenyl-diphosphate phosphatase [Synergistaceae bacterium]|jgi:undecaprenyl-diphosphatase|nr:undecaprenyl-diphosphate phosphatase [Synergistaceae bacterium]